MNIVNFRAGGTRALTTNIREHYAARPVKCVRRASFRALRALQIGREVPLIRFNPDGIEMPPHSLTEGIRLAIGVNIGI
jgi:hypothetical protein